MCVEVYYEGGGIGTGQPPVLPALHKPGGPVGTSKACVTSCAVPVRQVVNCICMQGAAAQQMPSLQCAEKNRRVDLARLCCGACTPVSWLIKVHYTLLSLTDLYFFSTRHSIGARAVDAQQVLQCQGSVHSAADNTPNLLHKI